MEENGCECVCCGESLESSSDSLLALCLDCRRNIFSSNENGEETFLCGNCETKWNYINRAESGELKCPACGYVDGQELFSVPCIQI